MSRSTYAIKKIVRKIVLSKAPIGKASSKRTKKVNYVYQDEVEDPKAFEEEYIVEDEVDSEEEEIENDDVEYVEEDDSESRNCYASKKSGAKWNTYEKEVPFTSKSHAESAKTKRSYIVLVEIAKFLNMIYFKLKGHCLNTVMPNDTVKRRELAWENVNSYIQNILLSLLQAVNTEQKPLLQVPDDKESIHNLNEEDLANSTKIAISH
ncbi:unnamed protein product [Rhizophagus irregularis]|uniref:Uncharacterized protein n=1 Tax=Rhizophagus irregularis TaxID=588596 RepID=A0A2N1NDG8_9GLOM|nr:hypothetical protein RhiirC2_777776 [Rhizophagus irregularis]CAB4392706.1 unnamed protein product [Rhizophagus irregularis]CAB5351001.1 unnamed protein product [Rhizophagus irregularis]